MTKTSTTPTLMDVANAAGVSTATVSRCLNSPEKVIEDTRARVLEAVQALGYSPNFGARVMAARRTNTIGAIIPTMENAIFARGLQAFQEELGSRGFMLLVASSSYRQDLEEQQIRSLVARGADGLLLIGHDRDPSIYRFLDTQKVPALVAWTHDAGEKTPSIGFDNRATMHQLTQQVLGFGHRRIAVISAPSGANDRARRRLIGIRSAMQDHGLDPQDLTVLETPYSIENGARAFETLMGRAVPPTAILCGNDVLAVGALKRAREMGIDVPGQVSVTGFDDIELAKVAIPALTTVQVPHHDMGRAAAKMLVQMVNTGQPVDAVRLDAVPVLRGSLGPAP